jgi:hypothetical protein
MQNEDKVNVEQKVCLAKSELNEESKMSEPRVVPSPEWLAKHGVRMQTVKVVRQNKVDKVTKPEPESERKDSSVSHKVGGRVQSQGLGDGWDW